MRYDIAIVGTGPAGISAALTAKSRNKRILLIGSAKGSEKIGKTHMIVNYPGVPEVTGPELNRRLLDQVKAAGIPITEKGWQASMRWGIISACRQIRTFWKPVP